MQAKGFEIGWHGASWQSSPREETIRGLDTFAALFGHDPRAAANHTGQAEGMYWAEKRLTGIHVLLYDLLTRMRNRGRYRGDVAGDPHYWGDVCRERIKYFRNFVFQDINTLKACPLMPYHDPRRPLVNYWFAASNGVDLRRFNDCLAEKHQDQLEEEGGACIMYTHFAFGFMRQGSLDPRFRCAHGAIGEERRLVRARLDVARSFARRQRAPRNHRPAARPPGTQMAVGKDFHRNDVKDGRIDLFGPGAEFDHIGLAVSSLDALPVQSPRFFDPIQKVSVAFFSIHGVPLEAVQPGDEQSPVSAQLKQGTKLLHLCFRVPDLDAAVLAARSKGLMPISRPAPAVAFDGRRIVWLFSPVLGLFELVENPPLENPAEP